MFKKYLFFTLSLVLSLQLFSVAEARVVFTTEENGVHDQVFYIDSGDTADDFIDLEFGQSIDAKLRYNVVSDDFELNRDLGIGQSDPSTKLHVDGGGDASLLNHGYFILGEITSTNVVFDDNEIIARNNGAASVLYIQNENTAKVSIGGRTGAKLSVDVDGVEGAIPVLELSGGTSAAAGDLVVPEGENLDIGHWNNGTTTYTHRITMDTTGEIGLSGETTPQHDLDIDGTGTQIEIGNGTASDSIINFDDGTDREFGWDDSETSFSTFNNQLAFRTRQGSTPPVACSATVAGMQWMDTDTGMLYICDTSNGRNKWLSTSESTLWGDETSTCAQGNDPNNSPNCNVDWGNGLGPDSATNLGLYIPHDMTITGYGFSSDNDGCTAGSFDVEVWSTGSNADDNNYTMEGEVATGLTGEAHNGNNLNVDIAGDQYILWGLDNNCTAGTLDDWNVILYYRNRHN